MEAAIMSYCLKNVLPENEQGMEEIVRLAGEEGLTVEVYGGGWKTGGDLRVAAEGLRRLADGAGVRMPVYGSGTRLGYPQAERRDAELTKLKQEVEVCKILGGTVVTFPIIDAQPMPPDRPGTDQGMPFERLLPFLVEQAVELADFAAEQGVDLAVLNHCFVCYLSWHQKWIGKLADRPNLGACVDPGNYLHYGGEDPVSACRTLQGCAKMARAGDAVALPEDETVDSFWERGRLSRSRPAIFGEGEIDQAACYGLLKAGGFDGVVSLKTAGPSEAGPLDAIRRSMENLRTLLKEI
jgi:sugar phosphate isomerase/epimerase